MPLDRLFRFPTTLAGDFTLGRCVLFTTLTDLFISLLSWSARSGVTLQLCDESLKKVGSSENLVPQVNDHRKQPAAG